MDDRASIGPRLSLRDRDEWTGIHFLLGELDRLHGRGLIGDDARRAIVDEYSARRDAIERPVRFDLAIEQARLIADFNPLKAIRFAAMAREFCPDRPEGWFVGIELLRKAGKLEEADRLNEEARGKFPDLARPKPLAGSRVAAYLEKHGSRPIEPITAPRPPRPVPSEPRVSWSSVAGEFLEEHWQKLISGLAVLLIVVSSTVGASLVLGPMLWSPVGKAVLGLVFTAVCAGFGLGLVRWGAERAGRVMLATSLIVIPINLMLLGELKLLAGPSMFDAGLVGIDAALLFAMARGVVGALGFASGGMFTAAFCGLAAFNAGATRGMLPEAGLAVFLTPGVLFLGSVAWLNRRARVAKEPPRADRAYLEFGLLAFGFLSGVLRTGGVVLQLVPALYAIPAMLAAIAGVSTARAIGPTEKNRRLVLLLEQGGLVLSALAFALALARPPGASSLFSGNILAVALLGLALYATSLRSTRLPAYLYCGFGALIVAYFGSYSFVVDLVRTVEEATSRALGYDRKLPWPFKAINGLVFNAALAILARFFERKWHDDRLARHCHWIGLPMSVAACVVSGFEPKAAVICLGGYAMLYAAGARMFAEPRLIYLACAATAGSAFFAASMTGGATLGLRSMIASLLGLAFWAIRATPGLKRAGEPYQTPLIHSARAMAVLAMAAATWASVEGGTISTMATLAFALAACLALLNGHESPRVSLYLLAIAAMVGTWLGGVHLLNGGQPTSAMIYGLAVSIFGVALLMSGEGVRAWLRDSKPADAYLAAMGEAVPVLVLIGWGLAGWAGVDAVPVARTVLVGSSGLLWLTRFRRESSLVYLGLTGLAAWAACVCGLVVPSDRPGTLLAWLAMTTAGCSMADWGVGEWARRRGSRFYDQPCFLMAGVLAIGAMALAIEARVLSSDSYRLGLAAMLAGSTTLGLVAVSRRWVLASPLSVGGVVGACYLGLLSQGPASPESAWVLALAAGLLAIACRGVGVLIRRASGEPDSPLVRPLDYWALALVVGAIPLGSQSPTTLVVLAGSSLLMIGCFPSASWLYGTFLAVAAAVYHDWLWRYSGDGLIPFVMAGAYLAWGVAVGLQRSGTRLLRRFGLDDLGLHTPAARVAGAFGVLAMVIRIDSVLRSGLAWTALPWLPWALAGLCLLMLQFEPRRGLVHAAAGLSGLGFTAMFAMGLDPRMWWLSAGLARSLYWALAERVATRFEKPFRRRLGIRPGFDSGVFEEWAVASFVLLGAVVAGFVLTSTFTPVAIGESVGWGDVLAAIGLGGLFVAMNGLRMLRVPRLFGVEVVGMLAIWWLVGPGSPLPGWSGIDRQAYLAIATAAGSLGVVLLGRWVVSRPVVDEFDDLRTTWPVGFTSWAGFGLGVASVYLAAWSSGRVGLLTLLMSTAALGLLALGWRRVESAIAGGVTWCLAWSTGLILIARSMALGPNFAVGQVMGPALVVASSSLWWLAGWVRARGDAKGGESVGDRRVASAMEWVAIVASVPAALIAENGAGEAWIGSGVLFALAVFFAMVAWRRAAEWPVYLAQGLVLACYYRARPIFVPSSTVDAVLLTILCYLDLGLAELLGRLRMPQYARPTLRFAMVLPLVPILQCAWDGHRDGVGLFVLLATSAFYAVTGLRLGTKIPAYASGVLLNVFLWLAWDRMGWQLAESPQFYLIPVGFSSILFAEANRRELGRSVVNGARNLGLVLIYASLAAPIWQSQSFGAWLVLLLLSLVGIFAGIGLRVQSFLWLGLACFVADVVYQLGRLGIEHALARWAVMLTLGVALILFVALNEKRRIVATIRDYYDEARGWE